MYNGETVDGLLSAAIVKYWYKRNHEKNGGKANIKYLDYQPETGDPTYCLYMLKYKEGYNEPKFMSNFGRIILCGITVSDEYIRELVGPRPVSFVWISNNINKETDHWLFEGVRDNTVESNAQATWDTFFKEPFPLTNEKMYREDLAFNYLLDQIEKQQVLENQ
jgi:hypothetical protein